MRETIRTFVAVGLPAKVRSVLTDVIEELRHAQVRGLRPARPEGIHLTLKFLGNIPKSQVESIASVISRTAQACEAFALELGQPGVFPNRHAPRVLWVGIEGDLSPLLALQRQLEDSLALLGFPKDKRAFSPHLTVARIREGTSKVDRQKAAQVMFSTPIQPGLRIAVSSISLVQSTLRPEGAIYDSLITVPLDGGSRCYSAS